jgi:hypothetical protein
MYTTVPRQLPVRAINTTNNNTIVPQNISWTCTASNCSCSEDGVASSISLWGIDCGCECKALETVIKVGNEKQFEFIEEIEVHGIAPSAGAVGAETLVTITGKNFYPSALSCFFR